MTKYLFQETTDRLIYIFILTHSLKKKYLVTQQICAGTETYIHTWHNSYKHNYSQFTVWNQAPTHYTYPQGDGWTVRRGKKKTAGPRSVPAPVTWRVADVTDQAASDWWRRHRSVVVGCGATADRPTGRAARQRSDKNHASLLQLTKNNYYSRIRQTYNSREFKRVVTFVPFVLNTAFVVQLWWGRAWNE